MHYTSIDLIVSNGEYLIGATNKGLYRSTNNGENWTKAGAPFDSLPASNLAVIGTNIFALTGAGVFRSTDNGSTWENRYDTSGYNHPQLLSVSGVSLFVVSYYKGVFLSIDSGLTWKNVSENLPKTFETSISDSIVSIYPSCISSNDTYLYIGTEMSSGLWRRPLAEMIPASLLRKHPSQFESNFPNPFSTSTTITFRLTNSSFVELEVYDVLGRKVRTLLSETLEAGPHSVVFDAKDLAQGVYVARLRSEGTNQDLKMVVVGK